MNYPALSFLSHFSNSNVDWILSNAVSRTILSDGILIKEREFAQNIYFVTDGLFDVVVIDINGQPSRVAQMGPGSVLGEMSWLDELPASATVRAAESSAVLALNVELLTQKITEDLQFSAELYRALAREVSLRLRQTNDQVSKGPKFEAPSPANVSQSSRDLIAGLSEFKSFCALIDKRALENDGQISVEARNELHARLNILNLEINKLDDPESPIPESARHAAIATVQSELLPYVQLATITDRFYSKPRGYAGDFYTIELGREPINGEAQTVYGS
jgi:CRP-like cAMP-binding protein